MGKRIKVRIDGKEVDGILVEKTYRIRKRRTIKGKEYEWEEEYIHVYIPSDLKSKKYVVLPMNGNQ